MNFRILQLLILTCLCLGSGVGNIQHKIDPGTHTYLVLFLQKNSNKLLCSGTFLTNRWILSTVMPLKKYPVNKFYALTGPPFYPKNLSVHHRVLIGERTFMKVTGSRLLLLKTEYPVFNKFTRSFAYINPLMRKKSYATCVITAWTYPNSYAVKIGQAPTDILFSAKFHITRYYRNGSRVCQHGQYACLWYQFPTIIYPINIGAPIICGTGFEALYCSTPTMTQDATSRDFYLAIHFNLKEKIWIAKTVSEQDLPVKAPCSGAERVGSWGLTQTLAVVGWLLGVHVVFG